jgi:cyclopropane-fatty-acyl-phospholipid synthase
MVERVEVPDGMAGVIRYESLLAVRTMAQRQPKKSAGWADFVKSWGTQSANRAWVTT